ncbi:DUF5107 domain-containing protein [Parabacteroides sp. FAFU027]|uniref:DUF5107 domain-containing protein n=1 Tax=Parabacteroides sp. FAFU027 TaxID=2922715 RepID=UPI001FAFB9CE|nr:DUF5107 domain-containing protein [Parabacteroides sp. FAFU027]
MVKVWEEVVIIPTYEIGEPEKNPMFLEKRVYQGSSGVVYPYPVVEKIADEKVDKAWNAVYLENEYLKIMILPELGGRVQMAYDKIKERHFIYYNSVIKPALVGLTGPWISGGLEFNWPQHHRPSTYLPVDYTIEQHADGSATVWVNEQERMFHQKGSAGFTLRPGRAVLELQGKLFNPTPVPQTFLWWANPAVCVNDDYQSVFPPDVNAVFDHGKRDVSKFPIATGVYYKMDYSAGVDISRYKNIPVPTSYMAIKSKYDFVGGYENDTRAGVLHVANHHISPGKKQWTWGNGDFGCAWDRNLTDSDGPYIELMTGVFTDNQPDFSWLQPYEEKTFVQNFMPYRELGVVKNACVDLLLNLEEENGKAVLKLFATRKLTHVKIVLKSQDATLLEEVQTLSPENVYEKGIALNGISYQELTVTVNAENGKKILCWTPEKDEIKTIPEAAKPALDPKDIQTNEQLFLNGLHIEQYRHATYKATDYYQEALHRDPSDARCNNAMGIWLFRKGRFADSIPYYRRAIETLTTRNPNPYDGEPLYNLGLALKFTGENEEAYESFYKACWNAAWQDAAYYSLAQISVIDGRFDDALYEVDKSLIRNWHNHRARHLKAAILRHLGKENEALALIDDSLKIDHFNFGCLFEKYLITQNVSVEAQLLTLMRTESHNYEEIALDYINAGLYDEAVAILQLCIDKAQPSPMAFYYLGWALSLADKTAEAKAVFEVASEQKPDCCFPNRLEAILALQCAMDANPQDGFAPFYLGNLWYDKLQYTDAIACWEASAAINPNFPTVLRNLSLAAFNKQNDSEKAVTLLEKAFALDEKDARILMELDQLYKRLNRPHAGRLAFLDKHAALVKMRDDLYLEYATLLNQSGRYEEAKFLIKTRRFHPWEGGEGKAPAQYQIARLELAKIALGKKEYATAETLLVECFEYPHNLGEGKLPGAQENDFNYFLGCAYEGMNQPEKARACFEAAAVGISEPAAAIYYNDQKPDKIFYQGLALLKLGRDEEARSRFNKLISYGEKHLFDQVKIDYFAVSLPDLLIWDDDFTHRNVIHCNYMMGLGYLGLGETSKAKLHLQKAFTLDNNHQGVQTHLAMI